MLKFALVGCGRIAKRHSELLGHNQIKDASLVAVCDIDIDKAKKIGSQFLQDRKVLICHLHTCDHRESQANN